MTPRARSALAKIAEGLRELAEADAGTADEPDELVPLADAARRAAEALGLTRHTFLVAVAALPLDDAQRTAVEAGLRRLDATPEVG